MPQKSHKPTPRSEMEDLEYIYAASSSEEEDWGDGTWEVDGIIGEHVNTRGERRYQVAWSGWSRPDGSNWTWEREDGTTMQDLSGMLKRWRKAKHCERQKQADDPLVPPFHPYLLPEEENSGDEGPKPRHKKPPPARYMFTELTHQANDLAIDIRDDSDFERSESLTTAFERLRNMRLKRDAALKALDVTLPEAVSQCLYELGPAPEKEGRYQTQESVSLHRHMESLHVSKRRPEEPKKTGGVEPPIDDLEASGPQAVAKSKFDFTSVKSKPGAQSETSNRPVLPLPKRSLPRPKYPSKDVFSGAIPPAKSPPSSTPSSSHVRPSLSEKSRLVPTHANVSKAAYIHDGNVSRDASNVRDPMEILQAKWASLLQAAGAAPVTFVNEFNDDELPVSNPATFQYLESEYIYGAGVTRSQDEFMESCDCDTACTASLCSCQDDSEIQDDDGLDKTFAYDANGLFAFSESIRSYVIECNKKCLCDSSCRSRVAQRPRTFPIEVFRTARCGWGVRSTVALRRGSVLGVYTGELITRATSSAFGVRRASYLFDLDFMVAGSQDGYSVDAYNCGNWTRFVNHSCEPVCSHYPVIWDTVPAMHQPKLAFVANTDIPARKELTIDYCPQARKGKGKARAKMPDTPDCLCGAEGCRGFIYLG